MFVIAHLFPDISMKLTKLLSELEKNIPQTISRFFRKMTAKVLTNNCVNGIRIKHFFDIF